MFIVKIPGINGEGTQGCRNSGNEILQELKGINSNEQGKVVDFQSLDLEEIHLDNSNLELTNNLIYKNSFETYEVKSRVIFLGGDHSVSYSTTRAFLDYCENAGREPCLIVFSSHADCGVVGGFAEDNNWLRKLIEEGFPVENVLIVGARNFAKEETYFLREKNLRVVSMNQLLESFEDTCEIIMEFANGKELYVSIDIDFVDPSFAPAVNSPEIGGLSSRNFIHLISRINKMKNLRAVDIVGIDAEKDKKFDNLTIKLAAKIVSELL